MLASSLAKAEQKPSGTVTGSSELEKDGNWIRPAKDFASTRYSALKQITRNNVKDLKLAWSFKPGTDRGHEGAPLYVNGTLYLTTPWPNTLYALDAQTGRVKWKYDPKPSASSKGEACCDWVNRGASYGFGNVYYNTLDGYTIAVNASDGREVYKTRLADISKGETITMAPLLVKDKVMVGNSGGEFGVRGWLSAVDAHTGKQVWRAYTTGPDKEVLIGARFKPFYPQYHGKDLGVKTWPPEVPYGAGFPTIPRRTWYSTEQQIQVRGIPMNGRAITNGLPEFLLATPIQEMRSGIINSALMISTTTTA
jgi:alcohol dehydrogenase (cytochrome c)